MRARWRPPGRGWRSYLQRGAQQRLQVVELDPVGGALDVRLKSDQRAAVVTLAAAHSSKGAWPEASSSHLHLQDLLQPLHDDQGGSLDCRVAVLGAVLHDLHQSLVGRRAQVVLVAVVPAGRGRSFSTPQP